MNIFKKIVSYIPNSITSLNLISGILAIFFALEGKIDIAALFILAASVFDFLDGMSARLLKSYSEIGAQMDSLSDLVSFGIAPAAILFSIYEISFFGIPGINITSPLTYITFFQYIFLISVIIVPVAGAFRLAKFNTDDSQSESFKGLPIPANAIFFASLAIVLTYEKVELINDIITNPYFLFVSTILFSWLMVSNIPMFSLKFKSLKWKGNQTRISFLILCVVLFIILKLYSIPLMIISYLSISIYNDYRKTK